MIYLYFSMKTTNNESLSNLNNQEQKRQKQAFNLGKALSAGLKGAVAAQIFTACTALPPSGVDVSKLSQPSIDSSTLSQQQRFEKEMDRNAVIMPNFSTMISGNRRAFFTPYFPAWKLGKGDPFKITVYAPDGSIENTRVQAYGESITLMLKTEGIYRFRVETMDGKKYYERDYLSL